MYTVLMTDILFDEDSDYQRPVVPTIQKSFFTRLVLTTGIVKDDEHVKYVLLGALVVIVLATIFVIMTGGSSGYVTSSQNLPNAYGP